MPGHEGGGFGYHKQRRASHVFNLAQPGDGLSVNDILKSGIGPQGLTKIGLDQTRSQGINADAFVTPFTGQTSGQVVERRLDYVVSIDARGALIPPMEETLRITPPWYFIHLL